MARFSPHVAMGAFAAAPSARAGFCAGAVSVAAQAPDFGACAGGGDIGGGTRRWRWLPNLWGCRWGTRRLGRANRTRGT